MTTFDAAAAWQRTKATSVRTICGVAGLRTRRLRDRQFAHSLFSISGGEAPTASVASPPPMAATARGAQVAIAPVIGPPENGIASELRSSSPRPRAPEHRVAKTPGREGRLHAARLRRGVAKERSGSQGLLHLGRHRRVGQARQPHERRGARCRRQARIPGRPSADVREEDRREDGDLGRRLAAESPARPLAAPELPVAHACRPRRRRRAPAHRADACASGHHRQHGGRPSRPSSRACPGHPETAARRSPPRCSASSRAAASRCAEAAAAGA